LRQVWIVCSLTFALHGGLGNRGSIRLAEDRVYLLVGECYGITPTAVSVSCIRLPSGTVSRQFRNQRIPFRLAPSGAL